MLLGYDFITSCYNLISKDRLLDQVRYIPNGDSKKFCLILTNFFKKCDEHLRYQMLETVSCDDLRVAWVRGMSKE